MTTLASGGPISGAVMEERRPSIAVVDDDSGFAGYLRTFLALRGYEARSYTRGDEIVAAIRQGEPPDIVLLDPAMPQVAMIIEQVADSDVTVLIRGESGVGKELVARAIHQRSTRRNKPFVKVNCAALPAELLESELFGHEKGAFTGAATARIGKFEQANFGTILLDEIAEMKAALQAKLLHVLQDAQFTKLGSNKAVTVDVRIVAATNRDLEAMLLRGEFREDLYYRLKVIEITVPPLRERRSEISHLTEFFMDKYARRYNRPARQISEELRHLFQTYEWPGNIRELENMIKRIVILQDEQLVIREMSRAARPAAVYAAAVVGAVGPANGGGGATADEPGDLDLDEDPQLIRPPVAEALS